MDIQPIVTLTSNQEALKEQVRKLCYFAAQGSQDYVSQLADHLVKHSIADLPPGAHHPTEILDQLHKNVQLRLDFDQVLAALRRLEQQQEVYSTNGDNGSSIKFGLQVTKISALKQEQRELK